MAKLRKQVKFGSALLRYAQSWFEFMSWGHISALIATVLSLLVVAYTGGEFNVDGIDPALFAANDAFREGNRLFREGKFLTATDYYLEALQIYPSYSAAWSALGNVLREIGYQPSGVSEYDDAAHAHMRSIASMPFRGRYRYNFGVTILYEGQHDAAINALQGALLANKYMPDAWYNLGGAYQELGMFGDALQALQQALKLSPLNEDARLVYCNFLYAMENAPGALHCFRELFEIHPRYVRGLVSMGYIYQEIAQYSAAKLLYMTAMEIDPAHLVAGTRYAAVSGVQDFFLLSEYIGEFFTHYNIVTDKLLQRNQHQGPELLFDAISPYLVGTGFRIFDFGCGTGLACLWFRDIASDMIGVDISETMLIQAKNRGCYDRVALENAKYFSSMHDEKFDIVIISDVFPFIKNISVALEAAYDLLDTDGIVGFTVEAMETANMVQDALLSIESGADPGIGNMSDDEFCWGPSRPRTKPKYDTLGAADENGGGYYVFQLTTRFAHAMEYVADVITALPFAVREFQEVVLRKENGVPVCGYLVVLQKSSSSTCDVVMRFSTD